MYNVHTHTQRAQWDSEGSVFTIIVIFFPLPVSTFLSLFPFILHICTVAAFAVVVIAVVIIIVVVVVILVPRKSSNSEKKTYESIWKGIRIRMWTY